MYESRFDELLMNWDLTFSHEMKISHDKSIGYEWYLISNAIG